MKKFLLKLYYLTLNIKEKILINYNQKIFSKIFKVKVENTDNTIEKLLSEEVSMSRYGDGEFSLMNGVNLKFQKYDKLLEKRLKDIIISNLNNHIVCIPNVFGDKSIYTDKAEKYWKKYLNLNLHRLKFIDNKKKYFNSLVTRLYIDTKKKELVEIRYDKLKKIWNNQDILIVEGEKSRLGVGNNLFENSKSIQRIICPSKNAFSYYSEILDTVKGCPQKIVLIALGPTATVLAYDLALEGYRALDIGHIDIEYEWFLSKAVEKIPIQSKYIGEIPGGDNVSEIINQAYQNQIIKIIKNN